MLVSQILFHDFSVYSTRMFNHTMCKSKCGPSSECSCENEAGSSSSSTGKKTDIVAIASEIIK